MVKKRIPKLTLFFGSSAKGLPRRGDLREAQSSWRRVSSCYYNREEFETRATRT
jgi:hypothetical protein